MLIIKIIIATIIFARKTGKAITIILTIRVLKWRLYKLSFVNIYYL